MVNKIIGSVLWLIGAVVLIYYCNNLLLDARRTYSAMSSILSLILSSYGLGIYLSLLQGIPNRVSIHAGRLTVFILSLIISALIIVPFMIEASVSIRIPNYLLTEKGFMIIGIICGYTFITGFFKSSK